MSVIDVAPTVSSVSRAKQIGLVARWRWARASTQLGLLVIVEVALALTTVLGYGLLIGDPPPGAAQYLATGAATIMLVSVGLMLAPQMIIEARQEGSLDWLRALPLSRVAIFFADTLMFTLLALPGVVLGLIAGRWRFDVSMSPQWWTVPVFVAVAIISTGIGQLIALVLPPMIGEAITQLLVFVVMVFSPVSFPASRLPAWLDTVHSVLPIESMANLIRAAVISDTFSATARDWIVVAIWLALSVTCSVAALSRRR